MNYTPYNETPMKGLTMTEKVHNVTSIKKPMKTRLKETRTKALAVAAGVGALTTAYFYGKSKGETNFEIDLNFYPERDAEEPTHTEKLTSQK